MSTVFSVDFTGMRAVATLLDGLGDDVKEVPSAAAVDAGRSSGTVAQALDLIRAATDGAVGRLHDVAGVVRGQLLLVELVDQRADQDLTHVGRTLR